VREGRVLGIDDPAAREDMIARLRSLMAQNGAFAAAIRELDRAAIQYSTPIHA
jgi:hypothetical protein